MKRKWGLGRKKRIMDKSIPFEETMAEKILFSWSGSKDSGLAFRTECRFKTHSINMPDRPARQKSESWRVSGPMLDKFMHFPQREVPVASAQENRGRGEISRGEDY